METPILISSEDVEQYILYKTKLKYDKISWSKKERQILTRSKYIHPSFLSKKISVLLVLHIKLRCSSFGRFMKTFNQDQQQDYFMNSNKLGIEEYNLENTGPNYKQNFDYYHNFTSDAFNLLSNAVDTTNCIDYDYIYYNLTSLILSDCQINFVDSLKIFVNLQVIVLAGNWIKVIPGNKLPKKLKYIECFLNEISDLSKMCQDCPIKMKHIGLGRNLLTNDSRCHLLAKSNNFTELTTLDLSNNNFMKLSQLLCELQELPRLVVLSLEGNPCYTCEAYKELILEKLPRLVYLDDTQILEEDRERDKLYDLEEGQRIGGFIFTCHRLVGIPAPPKGGGITHTFHLEVELPLLEKIEIPKIEVPEIKEPEIIEQASTAESDTDKSSKTGKDKGKGIGKGKEKDKDKEKKGKEKKEKKEKKKKEKKINIPKPVKGPGIYGLPDEYEHEVTHNVINTSFKTEPRTWNKIIKYNDPSIIIDENNFTLLRDTLRSRIRVKIVYMQKFIPKHKGAVTEANPQEYILKKSTCAKFSCDLRNVNWSDQYVDYIWADSPKVKNGIPVDGSLKPEVYAEKGKGKKPPKAKKKAKNETENTKTTEFEKIPLPTILTCHVGFGLKRNGLVQQIIQNETKKKKKK